MITHLKKLCISLLLCITASVVHAEYIVYKEGRDAAGTAVMLPLGEREHAQAYAVLMKYQFPMSLCHDLEKELSKDELASLDKDEEAFIQSKMPMGIKVAFVPTTLYELFFVHNYCERLTRSDAPTRAVLSEEYQRLINECYVEPLKVAHILQDPHESIIQPWSENTFNAIMADSNNKPEIRRLHHLINTIVVTRLSGSLDSEHYKQEALGRVKSVIRLCDEMPSYAQEIAKLFNTLQPLILPVLDNELRAHQGNTSLLYRGTDGGDSTMHDSTIYGQSSHTLSFANNLLHAVVHDSGACPLTYHHYSKLFYSVAIKKADYRTKSKPYQLFFITPIPTCIAMLVWGGMHSRSKVYCDNNRIYKIALPRSFTPSLSHLFAKHYFSSAQDFEQNFQNYLTEHATFLYWGEKPVTNYVLAKHAAHAKSASMPIRAKL